MQKTVRAPTESKFIPVNLFYECFQFDFFCIGEACTNFLSCHRNKKGSFIIEKQLFDHECKAEWKGRRQQLYSS